MDKQEMKVSYKVQKFYQGCQNGKYESPIEYAKNLMIDALGEFEDLEEDEKDQQGFLNQFVREYTGRAFFSGGFELWFDEAANYVGRWIIEGYDVYIDTFGYIAKCCNCNTNICTLHYAIVMNNICELLERLPEAATKDDVQAFISDIERL